MTASYQIEPELRSPPPRRVVKKQASFSISAIVGYAGICIVVIALSVLDLFLLRQTATQAAMELNGKETTGQITQITEDSASESNSVIDYKFRVGQKEYRSHDSKNIASFTDMKLGRNITVRYLPFEPEISEVLLEGQGMSVPGLAVSTFFVSMIAYGAVYALWVSPWTTRRLYRRGEIAVGTITDKRCKDEENNNYTLHYEFMTASSVSSRSITSTVVVKRAEYEAVNIGDQLTILYNPRKPQSHVCYQYANYVTA